jgi:C-terminal peptidase prc
MGFLWKLLFIATIIIQHFSSYSARLSSFRTDSLGVTQYRREKLKYRRNDLHNKTKAMNNVDGGSDNIGLEIFYYIKNYFYNKHKLSEAEWTSLYDELYKIGELKRAGPPVLSQKLSNAMDNFFLGNKTSSSSHLLAHMPATIHKRLFLPLVQKLVDLESQMKWSVMETECSDCICSVLSSHLNDPYTSYISATKLRQRIKGISNECISTGIELSRRVKLMNPFALVEQGRRRVDDISRTHHPHPNGTKSSKASLMNRILAILPMQRRIEVADDIIDETVHLTKALKAVSKAIRNRLLSFAVTSVITSTAYCMIFFTSESFSSPLLSSLSIPKLKLFCKRISYGGVFLSAAMLYRITRMLINSIEVEESVSEQSAIEVGDRILTIDGKFVGHLNRDHVEEYLNRGEHGDLVHVGLIRNSSMIIAPIYRGITVDNRIEYSLLSPVKRSLAYIQLKDFNGYTYQEVSNALTSIYHYFSSDQTAISTRRNISDTGIVIDVRGNRGGMLVSAYDLATLFLWKGSPIAQLSVGGKVEKHYSINPDMNPSTRIPFRHWCKQVKIVILVDEHTASASEVFAAAMQGNQRAIVAGCYTTAKNKAQAVIDLDDGSGLIFTIRELLDPHGR